VYRAAGDIDQAERAADAAVELCELKGNVVAAARIRNGTPTFV
jgi:hypothetical protein